MPAQLQASFDDKLLSVRTPALIHKLAATSKKLPSKGGKTLRMSRYQRLPIFPVALGPTGATPPAVVPQRTDIDATMSFYGYTAVVKSSLIDLNAYDAIALG
jgi:hypothetical protein